MDTLKTSAVRFFLSAALSPRVQAASRWIAINATSRKSFSISGKDSGCPFLWFLASGRDSDFTAPFEAAVKSLGVDETIASTSFLDWYRQLNHGYPFLDYSKEETRLLDTDLMAAYAATEQAPPIITERAALGRSLAHGKLEFGVSKPQEPSENLIAGWLRAAAGITQVRHLFHSTIAFRTSPSGGARHPTDLGLHLSGDWPAGLAGNWWYDPLDHKLMPTPDEHLTRVSTTSPTSAIFIVSSHVRRAMWRYRDARAFRPVIIDAGHVVETLLSVIAYTGWIGWWRPAAGFVESAGDLDPVFGYIIATPNKQPVDVSIDSPTLINRNTTGRLRTNPLISLRAATQEVVGENHFNHGSPITLTPSMIDTLAYATPSSRNDRPTAISDIQTRYSITTAELDALVNAGLLLPEAEGDRLWTLTRMWSKHDWFLSLLAHSCEAAGSVNLPPRLVEFAHSCPSSLPQALDLRRTSRALFASPLPVRVAEDLLASLAVSHNGIGVVLSTRHQLGSLECGTYLLHDGSYKFQTSTVPSEDEVMAAAIGQPWARQFSCIVWLIPDPASEPGHWEAALIECGRVAQRLTLAICDDPQIGIFQSPALVDNKLSDILNAHALIDGAYMIGIGMTEHNTNDETAKRFQPSSLFALMGDSEA